MQSKTGEGRMRAHRTKAQPPREEKEREKRKQRGYSKGAVKETLRPLVKDPFHRKRESIY